MSGRSTSRCRGNRCRSRRRHVPERLPALLAVLGNAERHGRIKVVTLPADESIVMATPKQCSRDQKGFSLVELTVVLLVISVLMVIGVASYARLARIADDKGTKLDLITAVKVQALNQMETGVFTTDAGVLLALEPMLDYSAAGDPPGTLVVRTEDGRTETDVCLFSQTKHGEWFAIYHSVSAGDLYGESTPLPCTPINVASWSKQPW